MSKISISPFGSQTVGLRLFRLVILALIYLMSISLLDAQNSFEGVEIEEILIHIDGKKTDETALAKFLDIKVGQKFPTEADLILHLLVQEQDLINERVFDDVSVKYSLTDVNPDKAIVNVRVKDSWTLIPIPYVSYNSNTGLKIGIETTYDNAFGSMTNWGLETDLTLGPDYNDKYTVKGFTINPTLNSLKIDDFRFSGGINMEYKTEVTGTPGGWSAYSSYYQTFLSFGASWEFRDDWYYAFTPELGFKYGYTWEAWDSDSIEDRYSFIWNQTFGPARVNRVLNNFRRGYDLKLGNNLEALGSSLPDAYNTQFRFVTDLSLDGRIYYVPGKRFNFYHDVYGFIVYNDVYRDRGEYIRGVRDSTMTGSAGIFQQNSFGINVVHWKGILNLQIHPFFDYGYTWGGTAGTTDEFRYGFGADILLFIDRVSNLTLCATIGFDPTRNFTEEIIIGTGYSY